MFWFVAMADAAFDSLYLLSRAAGYKSRVARNVPIKKKTKKPASGFDPNRATLLGTSSGSVPGTASGSVPCLDIRPPRQELLLHQKRQLGQGAADEEDRLRAGGATPPRGWLTQYAVAHAQHLKHDRQAREKFVRNLTVWKRLARSGSLPAASTGGKALYGAGRSGYACSHTRESKRKRKAPVTSSCKAPALRAELFDWFIDFSTLNKCRIASSTILDQARLLKARLQEVEEEQVRDGTLDRASMQKMPKLEGTGAQTWLRRWRATYGVTWRTVNLRFKCSHETLCRRLLVFWHNILVVRWLHHYLHVEPRVALTPEQASQQPRLRFDNSDQKPLWFNSSAATKTLGLRGAERVTVKELVSATRERFTVMTRVSWPQPPADGRDIAIMFKAASGESIRVELDPLVPENCLLQFGPKGSYRLEQTLDYYNWIVPHRSRSGFDPVAPGSSVAGSGSDPAVLSAPKAGSGSVPAAPGPSVAGSGSVPAGPAAPTACSGSVPAVPGPSVAGSGSGPAVLSASKAGSGFVPAAPGPSVAGSGSVPAGPPAPKACSGSVPAAPGVSVAGSGSVPAGLSAPKAGSGFVPATDASLAPPPEVHHLLGRRRKTPTGPPPPVNDIVVYLADWFAPNLDPDLAALIHERGHCLVLYPGLVTGHVQVNDTHAHAPYSKHYKTLETAANQAELALGKAIPDYSRSTVMTRACEAWTHVHHEAVSHGFVSNGICNALDGSEDVLLNADVKPFWDKLHMSGLRERLRVKVQTMVHDGTLSDMSQYPMLLEANPACKYCEEGHECFKLYGGSADGNDKAQELGEGDVETHADDDALALETELFEGSGCVPPDGVAAPVDDLVVSGFVPATDPSAPASLADGPSGFDPEVPSSSGSAPSDGVLALPSAETARQSLWSATQEQQVRAVKAALAASTAEGGFPPLDNYLQRSLSALAQSKHRADDPASVALRQYTLLNAGLAEKQRLEFQTQRLDVDAKRLELSRTRAALQLEKAKGKDASAEAMLKHGDAKAKYLAAKQAAEATAQNERDYNTHFAAVKAREILQFYKDNPGAKEDLRTHVKGMYGP